MRKLIIFFAAAMMAVSAMAIDQLQFNAVNHET